MTTNDSWGYQRAKSPRTIVRNPLACEVAMLNHPLGENAIRLLHAKGTYLLKIRPAL
jgi:hypothetical protein